VDIGGPADQPKPDQGLPEPQPHPEHPIYIPVPPPPNSGLSPEHPIYIPVAPTHPIVLPPLGGDGGDGEWTDEVKEKLKAFLTGNLPPFNPPEYVAPV
jgi:hypothetical protein